MVQSDCDFSLETRVFTVNIRLLTASSAVKERENSKKTKELPLAV